MTTMRSLTDGQWHCVALVVSSGVVELSLDDDGRMTSPLGAPRLLDGRGALAVAAHPYTGRRLRALMQNVRLYDRKLTSG